MGRVLIVGVAGGQGALLARRLLREHEVIGVDRTPWPSKPPEIPYYQVDVRSRQFQDILRTQQPTTVVHLGFVRHFRESSAKRYDMNVRGTRKLLDNCQMFNIPNVVVQSTSYVYGALPDNPGFMDEDYPLSASRNYPEIRDLVEVDTLASAFMWKYPRIRMSVLRPVPTLGHYVRNSMVGFLRMRRVITMMGFDPMLQFMHEEDLIEAMALTVNQEQRGIFNIVGPGEVPLHVAIRETGGNIFPLPEFAARPLIRRLFRLGMFPFPAGAIDYIKYPSTLCGDRFSKETGFRPLFSLKECFRSIRP